jgi:glycogen debranching enzyme
VRPLRVPDRTWHRRDGVKALAQSAAPVASRGGGRADATILEGSTFCISDDRGDIAVETSGLFAHDTRFLSRLVLRIDGERPLLLSSGRVGHYAAAFYLRNPAVNGLASDSLSVARERFVGTGLQERITVRNETMERLEVTLSLDLGADFADIISVKHHDFSLGDEHALTPLPALGRAERGQLPSRHPR